MTPLEKQWALLQGAVLDEAPEGVAGIEPELSVLELDGVEVQMENIQSDGEMLTVGEDARITLSFDAPAGCELYVELEGFAFQDGLIDLGNRVYFSSGGIDTDILLMPSGFELDLLDRGGYPVSYTHLQAVSWVCPVEVERKDDDLRPHLRHRPPHSARPGCDLRPEDVYKRQGEYGRHQSRWRRYHFG